MLSDQKKFEKIVNIYFRLSIRNFTWISTALTMLVTLLLARSTKQNIQYNFKHKHSRYFSRNRWIYFCHCATHTHTGFLFLFRFTTWYQSLDLKIDFCHLPFFKISFAYCLEIYMNYHRCLPYVLSLLLMFEIKEHLCF